MTATDWTTDDAEAAVRAGFVSAGIDLIDLSVRRYPEETIFVVAVSPEQMASAAKVGNDLDKDLVRHGFDGFVTVRQMERADSIDAGAPVAGVHDGRATDLVRLLQTRARTSVAQPSVLYVPDSTATIAAATAARHHLLFGRRGAGKTALLVEAKRRLEEQGVLTAWINMQPYRWTDHAVTASALMQRLLEVVEVYYRGTATAPQVAATAAQLRDSLESLVSRGTAEVSDVRRVLPQVQAVMRRFTETTGQRVYVFLDDYYFVPRVQQIDLLDDLHACVRDSDTWLKIATIRHLTQWFDPSRQLGLQTGHDADVLDLDVTLQEPAKAKAFLETVLRNYASRSGIGAVGRIVSGGALDRLVLASGAVPRDYLVLASSSLALAQQRTSARTVGIQDVNKAAGDAAQVKLQELEEDLAPEGDWSTRTRRALDELLAFCLDKEKWTYFRVDFRDRDQQHDEYELLTSLMDLRMIHLLNGSVSDEKRAGEKSEVYLLDLSQYSGERLKKHLHILDFVNGHFVQRETGRTGSSRVGDTPKRLIALLRRAPLLSLRDLASTTPAGV